MVTNLDDTKANRLQIKQDAIQMLIDEILKLDAAKQLIQILRKETVKKPKAL